MIDRIISFSVNNKLFIGILTVLLIAWGSYSLFQLPVDAVPDITNNQVQVITVTPNLATQEVEQFITFPVEMVMSNIPGVNEIRSISRFGLSVVTIVFEDDMGTYLPRQLISEKLNEIKDEIPKELGEPFMGPITTGLGEIYQYTLVPQKGFESIYSATELRTIQDWLIKRQLAMLPGVVEVNSYGGFIKKYEVAIDPEKLKAINITISDIYQALQKNNANTGGSYIEKDHKAYFIRGEGLVQSIEDIENIVVKNVQGIPIHIGDIARVQIGANVRYGLFTRNGAGEAVGGMIMMLKGANAMDVIIEVKKRITQIQHSLPQGLIIKPFIDRSELIDRTTSTIWENLTVGGLIVIFALVVLLGNYRAGLIVASTIPLAMLFAFGMMHLSGIWINLMSLGAIDFGILVDGAVIIVEGIVFTAMSKSIKVRRLLNPAEMDTISKKQSSKMMRSAFFGQLIILIVYLPVLTLTGVEGKMFKPMAYVLTFAMIGVLILCFTYVPVVSALLLSRGNKQNEAYSFKIMRIFHRLYSPLLEKALKRKALTIIITALIFLLSLILFVHMGGEFLPQLDEGTIAFHIIQQPGSNLSEGKAIATRIEKKLLASHPEIEEIVSRFGVSEVPTDPMPMDIADVFIRLKPESEWQNVDSKNELIAKIKETLVMFPGVTYEFTQPIEMRFNELLSGVREDIAIKIYGDDLDILARKAREVENIVRGIKGVGELKAEAVQGLPQISISYNRNKIARYGINVENLNSVVNAAFGGKKAGVIFEGEKRFDLVIRLDERYRQNIDHIKDIYIPLPDGNQIPLREIANISYKSAPIQISRENTNRRTYVGINISGRDVTSLVTEIKTLLDQELDLPAGYYIEYGGAFENFREATKRLKIVVPLALLLIFVILYFSLNSFRQTMMIYTAIPLAGIGGVISLFVRNMPFSISAGIGFIALFGVAVLNGLVLINRFNELKAEGVADITERIKAGTKSRLRPIILTASTDILGFIPMAVSTSAGAEVQRPLATVVIGGLLTSSFLTLIVLPVLYYWFESGFRRVLSKKLTGNSFVRILAVFIMLIMPLKAQEPAKEISLDQAVQIALENFPQVHKARLQTELENSMKKGAWDFGDTEIFYSRGETDGTSASGVESFGLKQSFKFPLSIYYKYKYQTGKVELQQAYFDYTASILVKKVHMSWFNLIYTKNTYAEVQKLDSLYGGFEKAAKLRFETGESNKLEMLSAISEHQKIGILLKEKQTELNIALEIFNKWLNANEIYTPREEQLLLTDSDITDSIQTISANPLYRLYNKNLAVKEKGVDLEYSNVLPDLTFSYSKQKIQGASGFYSYEIGLSLPLWFLPRQAKIQQTSYASKIAKKDLEQKELELMVELKNKLQAHGQLSETVAYFNTQALVLADEQIEFANKSYFAGEIDYVEYIQNIQQAFQIKLDYLAVLKEHNQSVVEIKFLMGKI